MCSFLECSAAKSFFWGEFSKDYKNTEIYVIPVSLTIPLSTTVFFDADCQNRSNKFEATEASKFRRDGLEPQNSKIPPVDQGYPGQKSFGKRKLNICAPRATPKENQNGERHGSNWGFKALANLKNPRFTSFAPGTPPPKHVLPPSKSNVLLPFRLVSLCN